ncbi:MAG: hypothetical protein WCC06_10035 [Candidatus Aminicenantales bacterium]
MKKYMILVTLLIFVGSAFVYSDTMSFKMSYFMPRAQSGPNFPDSLWTIELDQMDFTKSNFHDSSFGIAYEYFLTKQISLVLSIDAYSKSKLGYYNDYVGYFLSRTDSAGKDFLGNYASLSDYEKIFAPSNSFEEEYVPGHRLDISITPIQLSLKFIPLGRRMKFIPYIGGGMGLYIWSVRLEGYIVNFDPLLSESYVDPESNEIPLYPIYYANAIEGEHFGRLTVGYHLLGGFMFPIGHRLTLDCEFKFNSVRSQFKKALLGFTDPFDLSGYQLSLGLNYWF